MLPSEIVDWSCPGLAKSSRERHIAEFDLSKKADHVLDRLLEVAENLPSGTRLPAERITGIRYSGIPPSLLQALPVIYLVIDKRVAIYLIADGPRDMQTLLTRRLLGG